jgi:hypothetical protein
MRVAPSSEEHKIEQLQEKVMLLRMALNHLVPLNIQILLASYSDCASVDDVSQWVRELCEKVVELGEPAPDNELRDLLGQDRVYCPLCKNGSSSPYDRGFAYPGGLLRHLEGYGNARECVFMRIARTEAMNYVRDEDAQKSHRQLANARASARRSRRRSSSQSS